jgi:hypothetical protein
MSRTRRAAAARISWDTWISSASSPALCCSLWMPLMAPFEHKRAGHEESDWNVGQKHNLVRHSRDFRHRKKDSWLKRNDALQHRRLRDVAVEAFLEEAEKHGRECTFESSSENTKGSRVLGGVGSLWCHRERPRGFTEGPTFVGPCASAGGRYVHYVGNESSKQPSCTDALARCHRDRRGCPPRTFHSPQRPTGNPGDDPQRLRNAGAMAGPGSRIPARHTSTQALEQGPQELCSWRSR